MDEGIIQFAVVVVFFTGALVMNQVRLMKRRNKVTRTELVRRLLRNVERKRISDLQDGQAAVIRGRVRAIPGVPLQWAPMRRMHVIGVNTRLIDNEQVEIMEAHACVDFELFDDTGTIRVDATGLELSITHSPVIQFDRQAIPPHWVPVCSTMLQLSGTEGVVVEGMEVVVLGMVSMQLGGASNYRDGQVQRVLRSPGRVAVTMSSDNDVFAPSGRVYTVEEIVQRGRGK